MQRPDREPWTGLDGSSDFLQRHLLVLSTKFAERLCSAYALTKKAGGNAFSSHLLEIRR